MWLVGVVVRRYIDILIIIINFPYSTCIRSFFGSSILTSLFIFKMFFRSLVSMSGRYSAIHMYIVSMSGRYSAIHMYIVSMSGRYCLEIVVHNLPQKTIL